MKLENNNNILVNRRLFNKYISKRKNRRFSYKTIKKTQQALMHLEKSLGDTSLKKIKIEHFNNFRKYLDELTYRSKLISNNTKINIISQLRLFFEDLKEQPGFRRIITKDFLDCWQLSPREKQVLKNSMGKKIKVFPRKNEITSIIFNIPTNRIIFRRARALIAFIFLTGARISAAVSMLLGLFNPAERLVTQDPKKGVKTKNGKFILTTIPDFDANLYKILLDWTEELKVSGFGPNDPLFPKAVSEKTEGFLEFTISKELKKEKLSSSTAERIVKEWCSQAGYPQFHAHLFRDSHIYYGLKLARTAKEMKAISINVGHENIETTMREYADLAPEEVHKTILNLTTAGEIDSIPSELQEKFKDFLKVFDINLYEKFYNKKYEEEKK